uniref:Uncharacterized protein n=1 Tax=Anguilla anguilla TaxID=7936 RepID=A0A0E9THK8_ANGAN
MIGRLCVQYFRMWSRVSGECKESLVVCVLSQMMVCSA